MDDRQLLEDAARAAGHSYPWHEAHGGQMRAWNPLTDDGDALRLAAKLCLLVDIGDEFVLADANNMEQTVQHVNWDRGGATRRAIVRAAAAIGRQMREQQ